MSINIRDKAQQRAEKFNCSEAYKEYKMLRNQLNGIIKVEKHLLIVEMVSHSPNDSRKTVQNVKGLLNWKCGVPLSSFLMDQDFVINQLNSLTL